MPSLKKNQFCTTNSIVPDVIVHKECINPVKIKKKIVILIFAVTSFIHVFCSVCLIITCIMQYMHTEWEAKVIGISNLHSTFITHFLCAALHLEGAVAVCRFSIKSDRADKDRIITSNGKHEKRSRFYTSVSYICTLIDAFSIDGQYFDLGIIILEVIEIVAASYQALLMSRNIPHRPAAFAFTLLVLANCMITPSILQSKNEDIKRYLTLFVDGIFDFLYSVSFPVWLLVMKGYENYIDQKAKTLYNDPFYVTEIVYDTKQVFVTSGMTLFFNLFPNFITYVTFRSLTSVVQRDRTCNTSTNLSKNISEVKSYIFLNKATSFFTKRVRIVQRCILVWGIIATCISAKALVRDNCHQSCVLQVYPWFNSKCMCIAFRVNCKKMNISTESMYKELSLASRDLFAIEISQCDLSGGPKMQNFQRFEKLFWLNLMFNQIDTWQPEEYFLPKRLGRFHLDGSNLTTVPKTLVNNIPQSLGVLFIDNSRISEISPNTSMYWNNLFHLRFRHSLIRAFPTHLLSLPHLKSLDFRFNLLRELPAQVNTSVLQILDVSNNQLSNLPTGLFDNLPRLNKLFLDGNPISKLPESYRSYIFKMKKFRISQTKLCSRLQSNDTLFSSLELQMANKKQYFCENSCSAECVAESLGDNFCDLECYTEYCKWDKGDCSRFKLP